MSRWRQGILAYAPYAALLTLAFWARISNYPSALGSGELLPQVDGDSFYHLHRILDALEHFPRVLHFDPQMNWPKGAFCPWSDGFDLGAAAFAALLGGAGHPDRARVAIALWPVLIGLLTVVATLRLTQVVAPGLRARGAALAAGLGVVVIPESISQAQFARIDHHGFEALVMTLLAAWSLRRLPAVRRGVARPPALTFELEGAVLSAVAVYGFSGSPIYVAIAALPLCWAAFCDGRFLGSGSLGLLGGAAASAVLSVPAVLDHHRPIAFQVPSFLQPLMLAVAAGGIACAAWCGAAGQGSRWRRVATASAAVVLAGATALLARPVLREVQAALSQWVLHRDPWLETIQEFRPLVDGTGLRATTLYLVAGGSAFLVPVMMLTLALRGGWRKPRTAAFLIVTAILVVLTLLQSRFVRPAIPMIATCSALAVARVVRAIGVHVRAPPWARAVIVPAIAVLAYLVDPVTRRVLVWPPAPPAPLALAPAIDLREKPLTPDVAPGVLANWDYGHYLQALAGLPAVLNGFGSYLDPQEFQRAAAILWASEPELEAYLAEHRVGVIFAQAGTIGSAQGFPGVFRNGALDAAAFRKLPLAPLAIAGSAVPGFGVGHLPHLMPRFASSGVIGGLTFPLPFVWGYERVRGAVVRGRAPAGSRVLAELPFVEHGRQHTYKAFADVPPGGAWELTLPFPSALFYPTLSTAPRWTASIRDGAPIAFAVPEQAVRTGAVIEVGAVPPPATKRAALAPASLQP